MVVVQTVVKRWSNGGQTMAKWWSNSGQMVKQCLGAVEAEEERQPADGGTAADDRPRTDDGQPVVKRWSNGGQMMGK